MWKVQDQERLVGHQSKVCSRYDTLESWQKPVDDNHRLDESCISVLRNLLPQLNFYGNGYWSRAVRMRWIWLTLKSLAIWCAAFEFAPSIRTSFSSISSSPSSFSFSPRVASRAMAGNRSFKQPTITAAAAVSASWRLVWTWFQLLLLLLEAQGRDNWSACFLPIYLPTTGTSSPNLNQSG